MVHTSRATRGQLASGVRTAAINATLITYWQLVSRISPIFICVGLLRRGFERARGLDPEVRQLINLVFAGTMLILMSLGFRSNCQASWFAMILRISVEWGRSAPTLRPSIRHRYDFEDPPLDAYASFSGCRCKSPGEQLHSFPLSR